MIVSFTNRFIYIAVPRTGSTATYQALQRFGAAIVPYRSHPRPCYAHDINGFHDPFVPSELGGFAIFAGCRNPYTRMVSHYMIAHSDEQHRLHGLAAHVAFPQFIEMAIRARLLTTQTEFLGDTRIDKFICMEDDIAGQLAALPVLRPGPIVMDRANVSVYDRPWYVHYDPFSIEAVSRWAAADFRRFSYSVDFADAVEGVSPTFAPPLPQLDPGVQ